jgi:hypothetical protein
MPKVNSSTILSYEYDIITQTLQIAFKSGRNYIYKNVPQNIVNNFKESESTGSFFHNNIRDQYITEEL